MSEISSLNPIVLAAISRRRAPSPTLPPAPPCNSVLLRRSLRRPCLKSKQRRCDSGPRRSSRGDKSGASVFCSSVIRLRVYIYLLQIMTAELRRHRPATTPVTVCFRSAVRGHRLMDSSGRWANRNGGGKWAAQKKAFVDRAELAVARWRWGEGYAGGVERR